MKNLSYFKILSLFAFIAVLSIGCSKKEDPVITQENDLSLVLTSDAGSNELEVVGLDQMVVFTVMGSDGEDYTSAAKLYVNDTEINGSTYTFDATGTFSVKALYEGVTSNILNFEVLTASERSLTLDVNRAMTDQTITFGLLDSDGNNTASEATFYVNDEAISGFTYSSNTEDDYEVYAEYTVNDETFTTEAKTFSVYMPKRNVVIEDYTGTWCGYCLKAVIAIDSAKVLTNNHVSVVAIHKRSFGDEPMHFPQVEDLQTEFDVPNSFPQTQLNRTERWNDPYDYDAVTSIAGRESDVSVAINSQLNGATLSVDAKVVYRNGSEPGDKLVVYLLENGIVADQANYFDTVEGHPYYGMGDPIIDYVHDDALRESLSNLFGDDIPQTAAFEEHTKSYTFEVPADYNADNLSFVVMVVKADNSAKNSQHAEIGETKVFQ
ncbi:Omp28-related outer membrane protein [Aequorivita marina]|uniref:Omp28-related outer membrane protein n=1 Tax=Aequorivita marina TaxID=3073654 RepID=UPI002875B8A4|nr:Omp28-related outer membrane protein [Aequorivita sp. S2608]MDS1298257.1 Omp28-related outer membrane protein [Aequorivita sp. S2608]